jgi:hypothetical protein
MRPLLPARRVLLTARRAWLALGAITLASLATFSVACFDLKTPPCAFACTEPPHSCPQSYTCGDDGLCYRDGVDPAKCPLTPPADAATDAVTDTGVDAGVEDDAR